MVATASTEHSYRLALAFVAWNALAFLAVFVYATHATQAIAFEWKPGFTCIGNMLITGTGVFVEVKRLASWARTRVTALVVQQTYITAMSSVTSRLRYIIDKKQTKQSFYISSVTRCVVQTSFLNHFFNFKVKVNNIPFNKNLNNHTSRIV